MKKVQNKSAVMSDRELFHFRILDCVRRNDLEGLSDLLEGFQDAKERLSHQTLPEMRPRGGRIQLEELGTRPLEPTCALHLATKLGHTEIMAWILQTGVSVNHGSLCDKLTPLHYGAFYGQTEALQLLLRSKGDVNMTDKHGRTPLHLTMARGHFDTSKLLIEKGADVALKTGESDGGRTVLHTVVSKGYRILTEVLLRHCDDTGNENDENGACHLVNVPQDVDEQTPLHLAAGAALPSLIDLLLKKGARANVCDKSGHTPLAVSMQTTAGLKEDRRHSAAILVEHTDVNIGDSLGLRPLHHASYMNRPSQVNLLLSKGADIDLVGDYGCTPLHYAFLNSNSVSCRAALELMKHGASVKIRDNEGRSALHMYVQHERPLVDIGEELVKHNAEVNLQDHCGRTPLHHAAQRSSTDVILMLIRHGAVVNQADDNGDSPLHYATRSYRACAALTYILVDHGAKINLKNKDGHTPLHYAAMLPYTNVAHALLSKTAKVNVKDNEFHTPLHVAVEFARRSSMPSESQGGHTGPNAASMIQCLLKHGGDANALDNQDKTPLIRALEDPRESLDILNALIPHTVDINHQDMTGKAALHYAVINRDHKSVALLLGNGAKPLLDDADGDTAVSLAAEIGDAETLSTLLGHGNAVEEMTSALRDYVLQSQCCDLHIRKLLATTESLALDECDHLEASDDD